MNLDNHILQVLNAAHTGARPVTIGDLAREFGVSAPLLVSAARRLIESGQVRPVMVDVHGVPTLRALQRTSTPAP
jgi:transposase-like protein